MGLMLGLGAGFAGYSPWLIGTWPESEASEVVLHAAATLVAIGLLHALYADRQRTMNALCHPFVLLPFALGSWSLFASAFARYPWLSVFGTPQLGEGALLFLEIALFVAAGIRLAEDRLAAAAVVAVAITVAIVVPLLELWPRTRLIFFHDWLAFYGISAPVIACGFLVDRLHRRWLMVLCAAAALPSLVISQNKSAIGLAILAGAAMFGLSRFAAGNAARSRVGRMLALLVVVLPLVALPAIWAVGERGWDLSIRSRWLIDIVLLQQLRESPTVLLFGRGWGHSPIALSVHLPASFPMQWQEDWDIPFRDFFHSHHDPYEALLAAGLPALLLVLAFPAAIPLYCRRTLLPIAGGFALVYSGLSSLWFQLPATVPFIALAFASAVSVTPDPQASGKLLRAPGSPTLDPLGIKRWRRDATAAEASAVTRPIGRLSWIAAAFVLAIGAAAAMSAGFLFTQGRGLGEAMQRYAFARELSGEVCAQIPRDAWRGDLELSRIVLEYVEAPGAGITRDARIAPIQAARVRQLYCALETETKEAPSVALLAAGLTLRSDLVNAPWLQPLAGDFADALANWPERIENFLVLAPERSDVAIPYFGWALQQHRTAAVIELADRMLHLRQDDPVALWFSGSRLSTDARTQIAQEGLSRLHRALDFGIERYIPVDPELKNQVLSLARRLGK